MIEYIFMFMTTIFFTYLAYFSKKEYEKNHILKYKTLYFFFCILAFLGPFLISALRNYMIGTDTSTTYYEIYNNVLENRSVRDIGYKYINKIAIFLFDDYRGVIVLTSLIISGISFYSIFKESKHPIMSVILFFATNVFFISMNMIRQSIATSIFILSIPNIKNRSIIKFYIKMILAFLIHSSAIIYFPMYFIFNIKPKKTYLILISIIMIVCSVFLSDFIISILNTSYYFRQYFSWYITSSYNTGDLSVVSLSMSIYILCILLIVHDKAKQDADYKILFWSQIIAMCLLLLSPIMPLMQRTSWLFTFLIYIYLPKMFDFIDNKTNKFIIKNITIIGYCVYMFTTIFILGYHEVYPYISMFE